MSPVHKALIREALADLERNPEVIGVMLQGSLARGDGHPGSDVDLFVLLRDGCRRPFSAQERSGVLVEQHYADFEKAVGKVRTNPMLVYGFIDGRALRDDEGKVAGLARVAREVLAAYRTPPEEMEGTLHWLRSSRVRYVRAPVPGRQRLRAGRGGGADHRLAARTGVGEAPHSARGGQQRCRQQNRPNISLPSRALSPTPAAVASC